MVSNSPIAPYNKKTSLMDRAKTLICEALDADTIGLKEVNIFQFFALLCNNFNFSWR